MNRLTIGRWRARYFLPEERGERWQAQKRLDRIAGQRVPAALAARLPEGGEGEVVRIRHLHAALWMDGLEGRGDGSIAEEWARLLATAIVRALSEGKPSNVVRYENHADFVAAFLGDLLQGRAWSAWMYEEFRALEGVPPGRAAAHLLAARPALLLPVALRLQGRQQWEALLAQMDRWDVALVWEHVVGGAPLVDVLAAPLPLEGMGALPLERGLTGARARNRLRLFVALRLRPDPLPAPQAAALSHHLALLIWAMEAHEGRWLWEALAMGEVQSVAAIQPLMERLGAEGAPLRQWLGTALPEQEGRAYVARLLQALRPAPTPERVRRGVATVGLASPFAGQALLLPALRDLGLEPLVGPAGLYQLLLEAVGPRLLPLAWGDLALAWMAGLEPHRRAAAREAAVPWPDPARWGAPAPEGAARRGAVAERVLRTFARGLRGFEESSPAFLAERFLNQPGQVLLAEHVLEVTLSRSPLALLLGMAGRAGEQGPIPWLNNRELVIHLP